MTELKLQEFSFIYKLLKTTTYYKEIDEIENRLPMSELNFEGSHKTSEQMNFTLLLVWLRR